MVLLNTWSMNKEGLIYLGPYYIGDCRIQPLIAQEIA